MSIDSVYTSATYNSYFATVDEATAEIRKLKGFIDVSSWEDSDSDITKENISLAACSVQGRSPSAYPRI